MTVNFAVPLRVALEVSTAGRPGVVRHRIGSETWRILAPESANEDLTAAVCFHFAPTGGLDVTVGQQAPIGSGLGGSSSYGIALVTALSQCLATDLTDDEKVRLVRDFEAIILGAPTGVQDHWAAVCGGATAIHHGPGGPRIESLEVDASWIKPRLSVFFTGIVHHSGQVNWQVFRRRLEGESLTEKAFLEITGAATQCRQALLDSDGEGLATAVLREWRARKRLAPEVCPEEIEDLERVAVAAGANAFKACGAGGGGSVLVLHEPDAGKDVRRALMEALPQGRLFESGIDTEGSRVD